MIVFMHLAMCEHKGMNTVVYFYRHACDMTLDVFFEGHPAHGHGTVISPSHTF